MIAGFKRGPFQIRMKDVIHFITIFIVFFILLVVCGRLLILAKALELM